MRWLDFVKMLTVSENSDRVSSIEHRIAAIHVYVTSKLIRFHPVANVQLKFNFKNKFLGEIKNIIIKVGSNRQFIHKIL